ncbi:hypothetical protein BDR07DRAFT_58166 [Suillus spraguei]|nr:hypothetical protein BDR07DRAFT_58166 [Suillus spraguei]
MRSYLFSFIACHSELNDSYDIIHTLSKAIPENQLVVRFQTIAVVEDFFAKKRHGMRNDGHSGRIIPCFRASFRMRHVPRNGLSTRIVEDNHARKYEWTTQGGGLEHRISK